MKWTDEMKAYVAREYSRGIHRHEIVKGIEERFGIQTTENAISGLIYRLVRAGAADHRTNRVHRPWPKHAENLLIELYNSDRRYADIAAAICEQTGFSATSASVKYRVNVLIKHGLLARRPRAASCGKPKHKSMQKEKNAVATKASHPPSQSSGVSLYRLKHGQCRFVLDEEKLIMCGEKTHKGTSWCEHHHSIVFTQQPS